jgi:hypothetical protein
VEPLKNPRHEQFAVAFAGGLSATAAYISAGYSKNGADVSAARLLANASVRARVEGVKAEISSRSIQVAITSRDQRILWLDDMAKRMRDVVEARAAHADFSTAPGGATGLLVKTYKQIGQGPGAKMVEEFAVDTGLLREMRAHAEQAAKELGQWTEKREESRGAVEKLPDFVVAGPEVNGQE